MPEIVLFLRGCKNHYGGWVGGLSVTIIALFTSLPHWLIWPWLIVGLFVSTFFSWRDEHRRAEAALTNLVSITNSKDAELAEERRRSRPKLAGTIEQFLCDSCDIEGVPGAYVVIQAHIKNSGSPSLAHDYRLYLHRGEQRVRFPFHSFTGPALPIEIDPEKSLFEITDPIATGAMIKGFLWATLRGVTLEQFKTEQCKVEMEFKDVEGAPYSVIYDQANSTIPEGNEIFPNIGNPIMDALKKRNRAFKPPLGP